MSQNVTNRPSLVPAERRSTQRIKYFFEDAELIVVSAGNLFAKCEPAALKLFVLFHLLLDLIIVAYFMLSKLG